VAISAHMSSPNVLILMCDQLQAGVLGCYGGPIDTPNIDRLATQGAVFANAICPTPICSPSRASMVTGVYPHTHGIVHNVNRVEYPAIDSPKTEQGLRNGEMTTDKLLSEAGYSTGHYGKLHLLHDELDYYPDIFGEHTHYPAAVQSEFERARLRPRDEWMNWYGWALPVEQSALFRRAVEALGEKWSGKLYSEFIQRIGRLEMSPEDTFEHMVAEKASRAIAESGNQPFAVTCSFNQPHDPNVVPSPYYEAVDPAQIELPASFQVRDSRFETQWSRQAVADLGQTGAREFMRVYYASVMMIDDLVGKVLDALDASGKADSTVVLFTADHGDMCGGHGMVWKSTDAFYDELVRVPLIVRWPGSIAPARLDDPVSLVDFMPTVLELAGLAAPDGIEGRSLADCVTGKSAPAEATSGIVFCERLETDPKHRRTARRPDDGDAMVRTGTWKFCEYRDGHQQLFDLQADPFEMRNLAHNRAHADRKLQLSQELDAWRASRPGR